MKKLLAILLIACMLFSVSALAAETTYVQPFTVFDFGSESRLDDMFKANLFAAMSGVNTVVEENDDTWTITVTNIPDFAGNGASSDISIIPSADITNISNITYGAYPINNGWGGFKPSGYKTSTDEWNYASDAKWIGKNQFMKIRIKNGTTNTTMSLFLQNSPGGMPYTAPAFFDVSANDTEFQTYIVDMCKAQSRGASQGDYNSYVLDNFGTFTNGNIEKIKIFAFGGWAWQQYADMSYNTYTKIQLGDTVEIDYMIFAPTAEMAEEYKSIDEGFDPSQTTTTEATTTTTKVETTTTVSNETTTTVTDETTTTVEDGETTTVADETTTTEEDNETTTTQVVADETTTTVLDDTTTTVADSNDTESTFPVWIIIVVAVVIGGVAGFFIAKKGIIK